MEKIHLRNLCLENFYGFITFKSLRPDGGITCFLVRYFTISSNVLTSQNVLVQILSAIKV